MSFYNDWGFTSDPFEVRPLEADEKSTDLLIGRKTEKGKLKLRIASGSRVVTVQGENGIGKTSAINACIYSLYEDSICSATEELFLPCTKVFQLSEVVDRQAFVDEIFYELAQTLIKC